MKPLIQDPLTLVADIENAAHDGAFGDNALPAPTTGQLTAGNYKKGRVSLYGLPIAIENPRNTYRTGTDADGKQWATRLAAHYGYFLGTNGADGDPIDCFVGLYPQSEWIFVINQHVGGKFDEHKCMIGFPDEDSAKRGYLESYERDWPGLHSITTATVSQFKWWLKHGNHKAPLYPKQLPYDGLETMKKMQWATGEAPVGVTLDSLIYSIRCNDTGGLMLDSVCMADIIEDSDGAITFDALVIPVARLEPKMQGLQKVMERASATVKPVAMQVSDPFKQNGTVNIAVVYELSDGQTVSVFFHNPDTTPNKLTPADEMVSWKWLLNKKDVTIVVAPEQGKDLNPRDVAARIMKIAEKNSAAFQRANVKRAEKMEAIQSLKDEIVVLEKTLVNKQSELEAARLDAETRVNKPVNKAGELDPTNPEDYAKIKGDETLEKAYQDSLDSFFQGRIIAVRDALRDLDWDGEQYKDLSKNGYIAKFNFKNVGSGGNVVGYWVAVMDGSDIQAEISDNLTGTPADVAAQIDAVVTSSGTVTEKNYPEKLEIPSLQQGEADYALQETISSSMSSSEIPEDKENVHEYRTAAFKIIRSRYGNNPPVPVNAKDGSIVLVGMGGLKHVLKDGIPTWQEAVATLHAEEIIAKSDYLGSEPDYKNRAEIKAVHRYGSTIEIDGDKYGVVVVVMEASDGKRYYDHTVTGKNESPAGLLANPSTNDVDEESGQPFTELPPETTINKQDEKSSDENGSEVRQHHIDTLQSIVDGQHDDDDLMELLDVIDKASTALIDAGLGDQYDDLIGHAAEKWAALDEKANG